MINLSIIIVNWNAEKFLKNCLKSIYEKVSDANFEIFVVDNASRDNSAEVTRCKFPRVKLIKNKENVGFAKANNQAIRQAKGKYLLLLNPDTIVLNKSIEKMVDFAKRHDDIGILGPKIIRDDGSIQPSCWKFHSIFNVFWESAFANKLPGGYFYRSFHYDELKEVDVVSGACLLIRKQVIENVGPMDEDYFIYSEETDWCFEAKQDGWKVIFFPEAKIIHKGGQSSKSAFEKCLVESYRSKTRFFKKHFNRSKSIIMEILLFLGLIQRLLIWFLLWSAKKSEKYKNKLYAYKSVLKWYLSGKRVF